MDHATALLLWRVCYQQYVNRSKFSELRVRDWMNERCPQREFVLLATTLGDSIFSTMFSSHHSPNEQVLTELSLDWTWHKTDSWGSAVQSLWPWILGHFSWELPPSFAEQRNSGTQPWSLLCLCLVSRWFRLAPAGGISLQRLEPRWRNVTKRCWVVKLFA